MSQLQSHSRNGFVIALTNQKGGVGRAATAVNLGVSPAAKGLELLLRSVSKVKRQINSKLSSADAVAEGLSGALGVIS